MAQHIYSNISQTRANSRKVFTLQSVNRKKIRLELRPTVPQSTDKKTTRNTKNLNDVLGLYSVIFKLNTLKLENIDMQAYLNKLDSLKENYGNLMPYAKDAIIHEEQLRKFFIIMSVIRLPSELESICNQILSGTIVPSYDSVSEQLLQLATLHVFGTTFPLSIVALTLGDTTALASLGNNQNRSRGGSFNSKPHPKCYHCNRLRHTIDCCLKLHGRTPRKVNAAQIDH